MSDPVGRVLAALEDGEVECYGFPADEPVLLVLCGATEFAIVGLSDLGERMLDRLADHGGSRRSMVRFCQRAGVEMTLAAAVAAMVAAGILEEARVLQ